MTTEPASPPSRRRRGVVAAAAAALALTLVLLALACTYQVGEGEYAVVTRFGDPRTVTRAAGLHFKMPPPMDQVVLVDRRVHVLDPGPNEYLTLDKKNVIVDAFMAWSVTDPVRFLTSVSNRAGARARLADVLRSVVGQVVGAHPFSALVSVSPQPTRIRDLAARITELATGKADADFGVKVAAVRIKRLNFPVQNRQAVFRRMEAERQSIATGFRSEGLEQYEKIKADANRRQAELLAEAERRARELRGDADAQAARIYAEAFAEDPAFYEFTRSLQTLETILGEQSTVVIPADHALLKILDGADAPRGASAPVTVPGHE